MDPLTIALIVGSLGSMGASMYSANKQADAMKNMKAPQMGAPPMMGGMRGGAPQMGMGGGLGMGGNAIAELLKKAHQNKVMKYTGLGAIGGLFD